MIFTFLYAILILSWEGGLLSSPPPTEQPPTKSRPSPGAATASPWHRPTNRKSRPRHGARGTAEHDVYLDRVATPGQSTE